MVLLAQAYSEPTQTSKVELFAKIVNEIVNEIVKMGQKAASEMFDWDLNAPLDREI